MGMPDSYRRPHPKGSSRCSRNPPIQAVTPPGRRACRNSIRRASPNDTTSTQHRPGTRSTCHRLSSSSPGSMCPPDIQPTSPPHYTPPTSPSPTQQHPPNPSLNYRPAKHRSPRRPTFHNGRLRPKRITKICPSRVLPSQPRILTSAQEALHRRVMRRNKKSGKSLSLQPHYKGTITMRCNERDLHHAGTNKTRLKRIRITK